MSAREEHKKRPPPIQIPQSVQPRYTPGPNAFALAAKAKQEEAEKQRRRSATVVPAMTPTDHAQGHHADPKTHTDVSSRGSVMTTFTNLMMDLSSSPRKSEARSSTTTSRNGSTTRSRHSNKSRRSDESGQALLPKENYDATIRDFGDQRADTYMYKIEEEKDKTVRADMEERAEKKYFKMMGQQPNEKPDDHVEQAGRYTVVDGSKPEAPKSPKKKLFGMSLPSFGKSTVNVLPAPPMPSKAAEVLGATTRPTSSSTTKRRDAPSRPWRPPPRSETSKSLPVQLPDTNSRSRRRNHHNSTPSRNGASTRKTRASADSPQHRSAKVKPSPKRDDPHTPSPKSTPSKRQHQLQGSDSTVRMPIFKTSAHVVPSDGGCSPAKFCPFSAEEYAKLIEASPIPSEQTEIEQGAVELEGDAPIPLSDGEDKELQHKYSEWWLQERQKRFSNAQGELPALPPAFYSPSSFARSLFEGGRPSHNTDQKRLLFTIDPRPKPSAAHSDESTSSILVYYDSELNPTPETTEMNGTAPQHTSPAKNSDPGLVSRVMQELQSGAGPQPGEGASRPAPGTGTKTQYPEQPSAKLTDILGGVSPSKSGYNYDFQAHNPSAVPSPLYPPHLAVGQSIAGPSPSWSGVLPDGSNILTHFFMCNTHMDVLGRTLYDLIADGRSEVREAAKSITDRHKDLLAILDQRFEEIKADISAAGRTADRASEGTQAVNTKLDKLLEYVKDEVIDRLNKQTKKSMDMENSIKALQNTVQDLQKAVDSKWNAAAAQSTPMTNPFASPPQHRSQPSLVGFPEGPSNDRNMFERVLPAAVSEMRSDPRYANYNYPTASAQTWHRPSTAGRDGRDENNPFSSSNSYYQGNPAHGRSGYMGQGYGGYYASGPNEHTYGYNQGSK